MRVKVTWALVALVGLTYVFVGALFLGLVDMKVVDRDVLKYLLGALIGSGITAPIPIMSWFKEKKISFDLSDSDPPATPNNTGDKRP